MLAIIVWGMGMVIWTLFWWSWSNNIEPLIQDNPDSLTQQIDFSGTTDTTDHNAASEKEEIQNNQNNNLQAGYTQIRVMMPKYFYTAWWKSFAQDLYDTQQVYMNFIFIDDLNQYRDKLLNLNFNEADLILFPYDRIESVPIKPFSFQQSIKSEFDELVSPIVDDSQTAFLPFAADPMMMYVSNGYSLKSNFSEIADFVYDWESKKPWSFPIFFGIVDEDYATWFAREYQDIVRYALMHYFVTYRDTNSLWKWIDTNVFESYNLSNIQNIANALSSTPNCEYFPAICTQIYNFVAIRFGFLSDADIIQNYFSKKKSDFEKMSKEKMPFSTVESPVRIWWRSIPKSLNDTDTINAVYKFLGQYMTTNSQYNLWGSTLSVFSDEWWGLIDNDFIWKRWYIMKSWWNYIKSLKNNKSFWQLINYQVSAKDYLKKI